MEALIAFIFILLFGAVCFYVDYKIDKKKESDFVCDLKVKPCLLTEINDEHVVILQGSKIKVYYSVGQYSVSHIGVFCEIIGDCIALHSSDDVEDIFLDLEYINKIEFAN